MLSLDYEKFYRTHLSLRRAGKELIGLCPFHDDHHPSLSINPQTGAFYCHACRIGGGPADFLSRLEGIDRATALKKLLREYGGVQQTKPQVVARFFYRNEQGQVLYVKERIEPGPDGRKKTFRFKHFEGSVAKPGRGCEPTLYNLPEVVKASHIFFVEGEAKVELLRKWGLVATCLDAGAASPWRPEYNRFFQGKSVVILPDCDGPGKEYALRVASNLYGVAKEVKITHLPGLEEKQDIIDWSAGGGTKEKLMELVQNTPPWQPEGGENQEKRPVLVSLSQIEPEAIRWLWEGYIPLGKITLLDGDPGLGKSLLALDLAARTSTGLPMPDGAPAGGSGGVVLMAVEDSPSDTLVPRLKAIGADLDRIALLEGVAGPEGTSLPTLNDIEVIEVAARKVSAKLLVIDPLMAYLGPEINPHRDRDVRQVLEPLGKLAERLELAVLIIRHLNKLPGGSPLYRGGGSIGIIATARCAFLVGRDPQAEERRILAPTKCNVGPMPPALAFTIEADENVPRICWEGRSEYKAGDLISVQNDHGALDEAREFLEEILSSGPVETSQVTREARKVGISERTLRRAKKALRVKVQKNGFQGKWIWSLGPDTIDIKGSILEDRSVW